MNDWKKCGLVDGIWYILEVQGAKRPLLGQWDEKNDRFVGSGLVGSDLDEAIGLKSGKVLWLCECPVRAKPTYISEDDIWYGLKDKKYWKTFIPREDVDDWRFK